LREIKDFYFYEYLKRSLQSDEYFLELIKYELDARIYRHGEHFRASEKFSIIRFIISLGLKILYVFVHGRKKNLKNALLFNANLYLKEPLIKGGFNLISTETTFRSKLYVIGGLRILLKIELIRFCIATREIPYLLSNHFHKRIQSLKKDLKGLIEENDIRGLLLSNDMAFLEKLLIEIFKELKRPSFVYLHGIPTTYNVVDNSRSDFMVVWSEKIKQIYTNIGVKQEKILVAGNPLYSNVQPAINSYDLDSILIISHSITQSPENSDQFIVQDRGALLTYLYSIQEVLKGLGVKCVKLRVHPSENSEWYKKNIDNSFYSLDSIHLHDTLQTSSLVIGPISTVFFDTLRAGKNYIMYEPLVKHRTVKNFRLVQPFNGVDPRIPVANSEEELKYLISNKVVVSDGVLNDYAGSSFKMEEFERIINFKDFEKIR
jgi:hypothetical protein